MPEELLRYTQLMVALDFGVGPSYEVVIVGNSQAKDTKAMLKALRTQFIPNKVVILRPTAQESPNIIRLAEWTKSQVSFLVPGEKKRVTFFGFL